ncbi:MAG: 16S rRNA (cytidine(1402)-2'-O)-methyltransferase [Deltaproteobacteria bacterium]|nr:MAG: 16S rRNA (cytidine(1402)-2'-O)-methyltransferase [Deltaproteobacteria bacterium]
MSWIKLWVENLESNAEPLEPGLYILATPIGNLEDISLRALRVLQQADWVAAEDTRSAQHLLRQYGLQQSMVSLHRDNEAQRIPRLLQALEDGQRVALVSEAGTPCISDPGYLTVQAAVEAGHPVIPVPGASAVTAALCAAGLPTHHFVFLGFLPHKRGKRRATLQTYQHLPATLVLYASPHNIEDVLDDLHEVVGNRQICIGRELTKKFEEFLRGTVSEVTTELQQRDKLRGEFVVMVDASSKTEVNLDAENVLAAQDSIATEEATEDPTMLSEKERILLEAKTLLESGGRPTKLAQKLARQFPSLSRRQAYQLLLQLSEGDEG